MVDPPDRSILLLLYRFTDVLLEKIDEQGDAEFLKNY